MGGIKLVNLNDVFQCEITPKCRFVDVSSGSVIKNQVVCYAYTDDLPKKQNVMFLFENPGGEYRQDEVEFLDLFPTDLKGQYWQDDLIYGANEVESDGTIQGPTKKISWLRRNKLQMDFFIRIIFQLINCKIIERNYNFAGKKITDNVTGVSGWRPTKKSEKAFIEYEQDYFFDDIYYTDAAKCRLEKGKPLSKHYNICSNIYLRQELSELSNLKVGLIFGKNAFNSLKSLCIRCDRIYSPSSMINPNLNKISNLNGSVFECEFEDRPLPLYFITVMHPTHELSMSPGDAYTLQIEEAIQFVASKL